MAVTTTALLVIAAVGIAASAASSIAQGQAQAKNARTQSSILRRQAEQRAAVAKQDSEEFRRRQKSVLAEQRARFGASGVGLEGTPTLIGGNTAEEIEFQAQRILVGGLQDSQNFGTESSLASTAGKNAAAAGFFNAGTTLLTGAGRIAAGGFGASSTKVPFDSNPGLSMGDVRLRAQ